MSFNYCWRNFGPNGLNLLQRDANYCFVRYVGLLFLIPSGTGTSLDDLKLNADKAVYLAATFFVADDIGTGAMLLLGYKLAASILIALVSLRTRF